MDQTIDIEARYISQVAKLAVTDALESLGLIKGWLSTNECRKLYGSWFTEHSRNGSLRGVARGNSIVYRREDIEALQAAELKRARLQLRKAGQA